MSEDVREPLKVTVGFERKVQVRQYETAVASIHVQADVPLDADAGAIETSIRDAFMQAKAAVFEQLGITFSIDENGVVLELIEKILGPVEVVSTPDNAANVIANRAATQADGFPTKCAGCGGTEFWDNRATKTGKQPDAKCKDKDCAKAVWIKK